MRVQGIHDGFAEIVVSERNLIALLNKVRREGSERTLEFEDFDKNFVRLIAEPDRLHYTHKSRRGHGPGAVYGGDLHEPHDIDELLPKPVSADDPTVVLR